MQNASLRSLKEYSDFAKSDVWNKEGRWDKDMIAGVIGVPWRLADGRWTVDRPEVRVDPVPPPQVPFGGMRGHRER